VLQELASPDDFIPVKADWPNVRFARAVDQVAGGAA
jgi:hypothetical protein